MYAMSVTCDVSHDEMSVEERNVEQFSSREKMGNVLHKKQVYILLLLLNTSALLNMACMVVTLETTQLDKSVLNALHLLNILCIEVTLDVFHADTSYFCHCQN